MGTVKLAHRAANRSARMLALVASAFSQQEFLPAAKILAPKHLKGGRILPIRYNYRARCQEIVNLLPLLEGNTATFRLYTADDPRQEWKINKLVMSAEIGRLERGDVLSLNLRRMSLTKNDEPVSVHMSLPNIPTVRKYVSELRQMTHGHLYYRLCPHYLPFDDKAIGEDYYFGDDYTNYPTQTDPIMALNLLRQYSCKNRLLDVGCALGIYTKAFLDDGFDAYGVDISPFAVDRAKRLVGTGRAECADLDTEEVPFAGTFETFWMWDVLEHFRTPRTVLERVSKRAMHGSVLFLHTSNSKSFCHRLFGRDWEGYSDYSHRGIDEVNCTSLRNWLFELDWNIIAFRCDGIWIRGVDPVMARLQDVFNSIPELMVLLEEAELGDFITVVASKR